MVMFQRVFAVLALLSTLCLCAVMADPYAVLVSGHKSWNSYPFQSSVARMYQLLVGRGVPHDNIIVMMYDDLAFNEENPQVYQGQLYNTRWGPDVYAGLRVDYAGENVTAANFISVLKGRAQDVKGGSGRVLRSTSSDTVFVSLLNEGACTQNHKDSYVLFPAPAAQSWSPIGFVPTLGSDILEALRVMHQQQRYGKLAFFLDQGYAGNTFRRLPANWNVFMMAASAVDNVAYLVRNDDMVRNVSILIDLATLFSVSWMDAVENATSPVSLHDLYLTTKQSVSSMYADQQVSVYGSQSFWNDDVFSFIGKNSKNKPTARKHQ